MQVKQIAIYGAGGFGREVAWLVQSCNVNIELYEVVCFIDDNKASHGVVLNDIPITSLETAYQQYPNASVVCGVGTPKIRQQMLEKAASVGFGYETIIHPQVECSKWVEIGLGTVICTGNILTTNIILGQHVQINLDCTIGHDAVLGDYTTLAPGVHISGCVRFGQRVYVGTGAVIINGTQENPITIGDDVIIGAGACVTKSVPNGLTVVGVPAKPLQKS